MSLLKRKKTQPVSTKPGSPPADLHRWIAKRAYELFEENGCVDGNDMDHWLEAEREVREHQPAA
ncbi:MAG: DUF2934 domain-containing protein [Nitrospirales bacterium]|nr:DUF2934 domain-containing protein [Nitrospirales bacterium]